ncbi:integrase core domain-containing protein [Sorangium sp. So ce315]|uniref:integrase core domain-containing protein n=1 Tax=Sorangium sp. So ce315 TaxID=3133299 RepID=UPI003F63D6BA
MPWKETCSVDERLQFIAQVNESDETFAELCRRFGISRKTGYKWVERYEKAGPRGLEERRPVAHTFPHATPATLVNALVELRKERPTWGPKKLRARLESMGLAGLPATSTIGELLKKHGLIRPRRRRVVTPTSAMPSTLAPAEQPNDTWCVDFKGHFALGDKTRCHPLTLTDQASRYLLKCEGVAKPDDASVRPHFERAFREFGLPNRIRSDNGPPFATLGIGGLSALSVSWIKLGVAPERIEPGKPQQNGRHERMHKTLKAEATSPPEATLAAQQRVFDRFRHEYNDQRPHEALGQRTPASRYTPSRRTMPSKPSSPEYPDTMTVRRVGDMGRLQFGGAHTFVSKLIANEPVGLLPIADDVWELYYGPILLAQVTLRNKELQLVKAR